MTIHALREWTDRSTLRIYARMRLKSTYPDRQLMAISHRLALVDFLFTLNAGRARLNRAHDL